MVEVLLVLRADGTGALVEAHHQEQITLVVTAVANLVETAVAVVPARRAMVVHRRLVDPIQRIIEEIIMQEAMALLEQEEMR